MIDRIGEFCGDKIGAVTGQLRTQRMWVKGFGRRARRVRRTRQLYARRGRVVGSVTGWIGRVVGFVWGRVF